MSMPTGDSPEKVREYYDYLQARQLAPHGNPTSAWHVNWTSLLWEWGFVVALAIALVAWIRYYRSTHPETGISPLDRWGGYTTEAGGRVPIFFWVITLILVAFGAEFVIGHLVSGQLF